MVVGLLVLTHAAAARSYQQLGSASKNQLNFLPWLALNVLPVVPHTSACVFSSELLDRWYCPDKEAMLFSALFHLRTSRPHMVQASNKEPQRYLAVAFSDLFET